MKNIKKVLAVLLTAIMIFSTMSVGASAAISPNAFTSTQAVELESEASLYIKGFFRKIFNGLFENIGLKNAIKATDIEFDSNKATVEVGSTTTVKAEVKPSKASNKNIRYESDNTAIASINANGVVKGVGQGVTTVYAIAEDGGFYAKCSVTVVKASNPCTTLLVGKKEVSLTVGGSETVRISKEPENTTDKLSLTNSNPSVVSTSLKDGNLLLQCKSKGSATVTVKCGNISQSIKVTVTDEVASGSSTDNKAEWTLKENGTLIVSGNGSAYKGIASEHVKNVTEIVIESGITEIGADSFNNFDNVTKITIPNTVTRINERAFFSCDSLTEITIPDSVTTVGNNSFGSCKNLEIINIGKGLINNEKDAAFNSLNNLKEFNVDAENPVFSSENGLLYNKDKTILLMYPGGITTTELVIPDNVTELGNYCLVSIQNVETLNLNNVEYLNAYSLMGQGVTTIKEIIVGEKLVATEEYAWRFCWGVENFIVDENNEEFCSVDGILFAKDQTMLVCFPAAKNITSYSIPEGVTNLEYAAFRGQKYIETITIPTTITQIDEGAFCGTKALKSIIIPDWVTVINESAFLSNPKLESITIGKNVKYIGCVAFSDCPSLKEIIVSEENPNYVVENDFFMDSNRTTLMICLDKSKTTYTIPDTITSIWEYVFSGCSSLESIVLPSNLKHIGRYSFADCTALKEIKFPETVTTIEGYAFYNCKSLTSITVPASVTVLEGSAFYCCSKLESATIEANVSVVGERLFGNCPNLKDITLPASVKTIERDFHTCGYYHADGVCNCEMNTTIYFKGTKAQWNSIDIHETNDQYIAKIKIIYN